MATFEKKAEEFIGGFVETGRFGKDSLIKLLKEQGRATRQACAEDVAEVHGSLATKIIMNNRDK